MKLNEKLELTEERKTFLNRIIVFGDEKSFIDYLEHICRDFGYDIRHYKNTYEKAKEYMKNEI